jgi:hypothetical protein
MTSTILISGAGQLGSRYLQGLTKCRMPLRIYVQDIHMVSLLQAERRWQEVYGPSSQHVALFSSVIDTSPERLDLAIVATTAHCRPQVVQEIAQNSVVRYWILEKVLAQSVHGMEEIQSHVGGDSLAWVNTPRRSIPWHQRIKEKLDLRSPLHLTVTGGSWGLACNAMHFLDLLAWWSGESLIELRTNQLEDGWFPAKRAGNWEIFGTLTAVFSGGSTALLAACNGEDSTYLMELTDHRGTWRINEAEGTATHTGGSEIPGCLPYQSEMTTPLVERILVTGTCDLPNLDTSVAIHQVFISAMLRHWQAHKDPKASIVPIT